MKKFLLIFFLLIGAVSIKAQTVYITKTGEKYHEKSCHHLSKFSISISLEDAKDIILLVKYVNLLQLFKGVPLQTLLQQTLINLIQGPHKKHLWLCNAQQPLKKVQDVNV